MSWKRSGAQKTYNAAYYRTHREQLKARAAAYAADHQEQIKAYKADYRATHQEELAAYGAAYRASHTAERKAQHAAYRAARLKEGKAYQAAHHAAHPEIRRMAHARRRARKKGLPATLTADQWEAIKQAYHHRCAYCGKKPARLTQDHVIPIIKGGGTTSDNIVPACPPCNFHKHTGPPLLVPPIRLLL